MSYGNWKQNSANVRTEPFCELAASSSQNSLPGGSFMNANADMNSTTTESTCELAASSSGTHCRLKLTGLLT